MAETPAAGEGCGPAPAQSEALPRVGAVASLGCCRSAVPFALCQTNWMPENFGTAN